MSYRKGLYASQVGASVLRTGLRVAAGTLVYAAIVASARVLPAAAGMMLMFPALNGLAFFFSADAQAASMARTMLWLPVINGALCALYMLLLLSPGASSAMTSAGWLLLVVVIALWCAWVSRKSVMRGIAPRHQLAYALAATALGALSALAALRLAPVPQDAYGSGAEHASILAAVLQSRLKIVLFAVALTVFTVSAAFWPISDAARGVLSGLPLVPFGGLVSVAADPAMAVAERLEIIRGMTASVWLGPALGVWYIYFMARLYSTRRALRIGWMNEAARFAAVVIGWAACFLVVIAVTAAIKRASYGAGDTLEAPTGAPPHDLGHRALLKARGLRGVRQIPGRQ